MSAVDNTPHNLNYLSQLNFKFLLKKAPHVNFFIQKVSIPRLYLKEANTSNPFVKIPYPGEHLDYANLDVTFIIDEAMQNYLEIHDWIRALGKPHDFEEYANIQNKPIASGDGIYSDITISILSNIKTMNYHINFIDAYPVALSPVTFNTTDVDVRYLTATASFKYTYFDISRTI